MEAPELVNLLANWAAGPGPIYRRLAAALRRGIADGGLSPGTRLPAERQLARALAVSRTTVVATYEELRQEGLLASRRGSGTRVGEPPQAANQRSAPGLAVPPALGGGRRAEPSSPPAGVPARRPIGLRTLVEASGAAVEFLGMHLPAAEPFFSAAAGQLPADLAPLLRHHGYLGLGLPALRQAVAAHLAAAGLPTSEEQILITHGAQQAIGLAASLFLQPGDTVLLEDPTYLGAIDAFNAAGARIVPVPIGPEGTDPDRLGAAMGREAPRLIYLMPTCQNPAGTVIPSAARRAIVRLAEESGVPVVEDNTLSELHFGPEPPPPPLAAFDSRATILTVGSLSKLVWGGLRVGWIRASAPLIARLARCKAVADLGCSVVAQAMAARLLGKAKAIRELRLRQIAERLPVLEEELAHWLPQWRWRHPAGGLALWVRLPSGSAGELAQVALRHGVAVLPGPACSPSGGCADYLRLPFVLEPGEIRRGVELLARAWSAYAAVAERPGRAPASLDVMV